MLPHTPTYSEAFRKYLRYGTPLHLSLKTTPYTASHYIWHTREDNKVRPSHAANDGKIFAWDNPPATGNPGEEYGCRCWAEPVETNQYARQRVITPIDDSALKWEWYDFVFHYYVGGGTEVTLSQVGLFNDVVTFAHTHGLQPHQVGEGVEMQVLRAIKGTSSETGIIDTFSNGYNFYDIAFVLRKSGVSGIFNVEVNRKGGYLPFHGMVEYNFMDFFQDPIDFMEVITMLPEDIITLIQKLALAKGWDNATLTQIYKDTEKIAPHDIPAWIQEISGLGGKAYAITAGWKTVINGTTTHD